MIICPFCQTPHVDNTLFCDECGTYLLDEETRDTFPLIDDETAAETPDAASALPAATATHQRQRVPPVIRLKLTSPEKSLEISLEKTVYLGRLDPTANIYPEIDFTEANGLEQGVSRQHARLLFKEGQVYVEDLGSVNGTILNGHRLLAYLPEPLNDGDTLVLGRLRIDVSLKK